LKPLPCARMFRSYPETLSMEGASAVESLWHRFKSQVQNLDLESVTLSVGTPLCPYGIAYGRAYGLSFRWTVPFSLGSGTFNFDLWRGVADRWCGTA
jgi:hypothetical protein